MSSTSSIFTVDSSGNRVTINITSATNGKATVITPPAGWPDTGVAVSSGSVTAAGGYHYNGNSRLAKR